MHVSTTAAEGLFGLPGETFLREYWQKKPHVFRQAVQIPVGLPSFEDMKVLAGQEDVDARIVIGPDATGRWEVHHGPFHKSEYLDLPETGWTLLIQDLDKWQPELAEMWSWFKVIPAWRRDDIMVSYASPGGSVGPHVDRYDVFLVQASGERYWTTGQAGPAVESALSDELRLCRIEQPITHPVFATGDVLYLPPNHAHHGVAASSCITLSFGMRAPTLPEMALEYAQEVVERNPDLLYSDADLRPHESGPWLHPRAVERFRALLMECMDMDQTEFSGWTARFLTTYAARRDATVESAPDEHAQIVRRLRAGGRVGWNPWCQRLGIDEPQHAVLVVDGNSHISSHATVTLLLENQEVAWSPALGDSALTLIATLIRAGQMTWTDHD